MIRDSLRVPARLRAVLGLWLLSVAIVGCEPQAQAEPEWNPLEVSPAIREALTKEIGAEFTIMAYRPTSDGVTCGLVTQNGNDRPFVWDGQLTLSPMVKGESLDDALRLAAFAQMVMDRCPGPGD